MATLWLHVTFIALTLTNFVHEGKSVMCYVCTGGDGSDCDHPLKKNSSEVQYQDCGTGNQCIQYDHRANGTRSVFRGCSPIKSNFNACGSLYYQEVKSVGKFKVLSCDMCMFYEGCNSVRF